MPVDTRTTEAAHQFHIAQALHRQAASSHATSVRQALDSSRVSGSMALMLILITVIIYHNRTSDQNETSKVECLCAKYAECGCDANNQTDYVTSVANNNSIARVAQLDGQRTLVVNGTLPNGTTAASAAPAFHQGMASFAGIAVISLSVVFATYLM